MNTDMESWVQGYLAGVRLHRGLRVPQLCPSVIASMSATGIAADLDWFADLSGVAFLTAPSAEFAGDVSVSYSCDGRSYTDPVPLSELLTGQAPPLFTGALPAPSSMRFRFHLADDDAELSGFCLRGFFSRDIPWKEAEHAVP